MAAVNGSTNHGPLGTSTLVYGLLVLACMVHRCASVWNFLNNVEVETRAVFDSWQDDAVGIGTLSFRFKTNKKNGLLLQATNKGTTASHLFRLQLTSGRLKVDIKMGGDDYLSMVESELGGQLDDREWHKVWVKRAFREVKVILDDEIEKTLVSEGNADRLILDGVVIAGGFPENNFEGFTGCIDDLRYFNNHQQTASALHGNKKGNVSLECLETCTSNQRNSCHHGGACTLEFDRHNHKCRCIGTGYFGNTCEKAEITGNFALSSVVSRRVDALNSYAVNRLRMRIRTSQTNGVMMFIGDNSGYLLVEMVDGNVIVKMNIGSGEAYVSSVDELEVHDGHWHAISVQRRIRNMTVSVCSKDAKCWHKSSLMEYRPQESCLASEMQVAYLGGLNPNSTNIKHTSSKTNFRGCMQQVYFQGEKLIDFKSLVNGVKESYNVHTSGELVRKGCDGVKQQQVKTYPQRTNPLGEDAPYMRKVEDSKDGPRAPSKQTNNSGGPKTLSKETRGWITGGIIVGGIVLVLTIGGIAVHYLRKKYSVPPNHRTNKPGLWI